MNKALFAVPLVALSACMQPPPPSPEVQRLQAACQEGDMQACATVASLQQQQAAARAQFVQGMQAQNAATQQANAQLFRAGTPQLQPMTMPRQTHCQPGFGGSMTCTTY